MMGKSVHRVGVACASAVVTVLFGLYALQSQYHKYAVGYISDAEYSTVVTVTIIIIVGALAISIYRMYRIIKDSDDK